MSKWRPEEREGYENSGDTIEITVHSGYPCQGLDQTSWDLCDTKELLFYGIWNSIW